MGFRIEEAVDEGFLRVCGVGRLGSLRACRTRGRVLGAGHVRMVASGKLLHAAAPLVTLLFDCGRSPFGRAAPCRGGRMCGAQLGLLAAGARRAAPIIQNGSGGLQSPNLVYKKA